MDFGCVFPNRGPMATPTNLARFAEKAEALGYDTVWFSDHIVIPTEVKSFYPYDPSGRMAFNPAEPYWEPLSVIGYVAGRTSRVRLGTSVLVLPYRNPVVTAKMLATLDVLSNGRITLGAGVGWMEEEFTAIGLDTYPRRGAYSDECIRIFRELWTKDNPSFQGDFHQFSKVRCEPRPVQPGGIPIWVGGHTPQAIRRAARLGDGWQPLVQRPPADLPPAEMRQKIIQLRAFAQQAGRDPQRLTLAMGSSIQFTDGAATGPRSLFTGTPAQIIEAIQRYQELGMQNFRCDFPSASIDGLLHAMERFASEVRPKVA
ncbi:MAG TPA: LLM class F420-dependent oxidoreductase [Candidatus Tectomicrobia bacterium]|nr:LLM class F420-dependent oxidoreductase [Candidatus Tectomicrobia bacterium]